MENMKINFDKIYDKVADGNITQTRLVDAKIPKNIISPEEKDICIFLYTIFQYYLEKAVELISVKDDLDRKEKGKKILISLLNNSFLNNFKSNRVVSSCLNGILNYYLGQYQFEVEELSESEKYYLKALDHFNTLPIVIKIRYVNIYQQIYNNLGIVFSNKGDLKKGLQFFGKAEQMYKMFCELASFNITNDFNSFMLSCSKDKTNDSCTDKLEFFNFFIDGGLDKKSLEKNYTMTIFYYAQAFTKLEFKKKAIKYCSLTLKRQIESNGIDLKDIIMNCNNLADFYMENQYFAQAEYVLLAALEILPKNEDIEEEHRASVQLHLGKYFLERLKFAVRQTKEQLWINENDELHSIVNKRIVTFNTLNISWPKIEDVKDIEQAKLLFRLSNTQFKKALNFYVLDGYVTEHININKFISQLYKYLTFFETDNNRIFQMLDRRIGLLEPIIKEINPKTFIVQWQELVLELADIYNEIFQSKYELLRIKQPKQSELIQINSLAEKALLYYKQLLEYLEAEFVKSEEKTVEELQTIITIKLNIARLLSKITYSDNKKVVSSLASALRIYEDVYKQLKKSDCYKMSDSLADQMKICEEMINLLPSKINKINSGEEI
jgi:hypothetical protein